MEATITKTPSSPKKAVILSKYSAWKKVKATVSSALSNDADSVAKANTSTRIVEFGSNGEIFVVHKNSIEVWDWVPMQLQPGHLVVKSANTLNLVCSKVIKGVIVEMQPLNCYRNRNYYVVLVCVQIDNEYSYQLINMCPDESLGAPLEPIPVYKAPNLCENVCFKNDAHFFSICVEGVLQIWSKETIEPVLPPDFTVKVHDGKPLYDIRNGWFVYVPDSSDTKSQISKLGKNRSNSTNLDVTPLRLPKSGPMLNKVVKSLSSGLIDGAIKLSEMYYGNGTEVTTKTLVDYINLNNKLGKNSNFVFVYDLQTQRHIAFFAPPHTISNLSLSPYDSHLATCNTRGDNVYIWDISRMPKEISLVAKHNRGKTPASIDEILWDTGSSSIGIVTRLKGSVHWFNNFGNGNSWILSSLCSKRLCMGPQIADIDSKLFSSAAHDGKSWYMSSRSILSTTKHGDVVYVISSVDGTVQYKYVLHSTKVQQEVRDTVYSNMRKAGSDSDFYLIKNNETSGQKMIVEADPLAKIELETCDPFAPLYLNHGFSLGNYVFDYTEKEKFSKLEYSDKDNLFVTLENLDCCGPYKMTPGEADHRLFKQNSRAFGSGFNVKVLRFNKGTGLAVFNSEGKTSKEEEAGLESLKSAMEELINDTGDVSI